MTAADDTDDKPERINRRRLVLYLLSTPLFFALFLFLPAGTWAWPKGWLFLGVLLVTGAVGAWYIWRVNPELYAARINPHRGTKPWDKVSEHSGAQLGRPISRLLPFGAEPSRMYFWIGRLGWNCASIFPHQ
ncbi:MAG: hypothetical protein JO112_23095 [Planctomycetes bacterium]|nr:hypothetical protein [Planctomycetota bacterium]